MPIAASILKRIKDNDLSLTKLDLSGQNLQGSDIQALIEALAQNTTLTTLDVGNSQIGDEEAKALAQNTTLTTLYVSGSRIGDEGAKALTQNTTLTTLYIGYNQIGDEGAKALAQNTTLTTLD